MQCLQIVTFHPVAQPFTTGAMIFWDSQIFYDSLEDRKSYPWINELPLIILNAQRAIRARRWATWLMQGQLKEGLTIEWMISYKINN